MRILYHHRTLGDGAEGIHVREMVRAFRELGHEVKVIGPAGERPPDGSKKFAVLDRLRRTIPTILYEALEMGYMAFAYLTARRELRTFRPDFIYDRYIIFNAGGVMAARSGKVPVVLEVNAPLALERSQQHDERLFFSRIAMSLERWICTNATETIVVSTPLKDYLESIGVPKGKCVVMANGVQPDRFSPREADAALREKLGIPTNAFVIGFTGILRAWHGLDLLLDAFSKLSRQGLNVFLLVVGDGPYRAEIERISKDLSIEHAVRVTGRVAHTDVPAHVSLFDAAVSPKATFYASPMKVIEYMALGKPVVVPGSQNFLDIIDDGINGVAFKEGSAKDLERALLALYQSSEHCQALGRAARAKVESRLNWQWNAREVCAMVERRLVAGAVI